MITALLPGERIVDDLILAESTVGRAWFSLDREHRLRLQRWISPREALRDRTERVLALLMLNPSTAGAFVNDPTILACCARGARLGFDTLDVVNLFSFRSPHPAALKSRPRDGRGTGIRNDRMIVEVCSGADLVISAWGNDGGLDGRDGAVTRMLVSKGFAMHCLGTTQRGAPKHPHARGKHRIPDDFVPVRWRP